MGLFCYDACTAAGLGSFQGSLILLCLENKTAFLDHDYFMRLLEPHCYSAEA